MKRENLEKKISQLPSCPGVYFFKNKKMQIIYVGKASNLKNRVRQYFQNSRPKDPKTQVLINEISDVEIIEVASEIDALFLEAELIKRYKPPYNIEERDDKSNLFIRIDINSPHPTVSFTRRPFDDGAKYFGPYISGPAIRKAMRYLRRVFPYDTKVARSRKQNLEHHLGLSPGLELGKTTLSEYRDNLRRLISYLKGNRTKLIRELEAEMKKTAKAQNFEQAAIYRNQISHLKEVTRQIVFGNEEFLDISKDQALNGLCEILGLANAPKRIEGYDISHMSGTNNVASLVVFTNGLPDKAQYRKFKMRLKGNDDFAHMREVLTRRFSGNNLQNWPKPDLILIDGGKGQLAAAINVLLEKKIHIPAIGLAKKHEEIIINREYLQGQTLQNRKKDRGSINETEFSRTDPVRGGNGKYEVLSLGEDSHVRKLLQRIRDESHRFAVSYHSLLRVKAQKISELDSITGIGPATRKKLIKNFGSVLGIKTASQNELAKVVGKNKASILRQYFSKK